MALRDTTRCSLGMAGGSNGCRKLATGGAPVIIVYLGDGEKNRWKTGENRKTGCSKQTD